ncbi:hypothetical protein NDU88_007000 [Pleurodeles waltl]|uniref:Uncharacterized protein n=1 Tax=Pleurodeles waltl TaxID=8319 RepID=A0AAV7NAB7_PLEWA|nr:hypothetical protein NDU88_007000 [Pleurodeles waltl]
MKCSKNGRSRRATFVKLISVTLHVSEGEHTPAAVQCIQSGISNEHLLKHLFSWTWKPQVCHHHGLKLQKSAYWQ